MKLIYITTDDPLYLPAFFDHILDKSDDNVAGVYVAPTLYKNENSFSAAKKFYRTFGLYDFAVLGCRVLLAKIKRQSIARVCRKHGVACEKVSDVNSIEFLDELKTQSPDVIISVSCPQIFKKPLIVLPARGALNIHGAILPRYRGIMPAFWMMANGETRAGVSIYFMNEKIDAGDLCGQEVFDIQREESLDHFIRRSKRIAANLLLTTLRRIKCNTIKRSPLNLAEGSYYSWPDPQAVNRFREAGHRLW